MTTHVRRQLPSPKNNTPANDTPTNENGRPRTTTNMCIQRRPPMYENNQMTNGVHH
ncbi:hypothetical protein K443DRAFT_8369 [Laccaria amethystina LaAM-08-1]|uniref:Uncharacterized protein n=1 Tax=Laccaria amethystina LaAM-08-1 TaxID=1095629 RepID=A0A0C9XD95_9AGAR|nr:hypothetical protein K443DRAFT_8369 [Laccaria amethystina LaAM-08-1]